MAVFFDPLRDTSQKYMGSSTAAEQHTSGRRNYQLELLQAGNKVPRRLSDAGAYLLSALAEGCESDVVDHVVHVDFRSHSRSAL